MRQQIAKLVIIWIGVFLFASAAWGDSMQDFIVEYKAFLQRQQQRQQPRVRYVYPPRPPLQPNGSYYTDEQIAASNRTTYNRSGKQQTSRYVEAWRSPLQRFDGDEQPGVYSSGYLGPLPQGPTDGPYCPPGYNCWQIDRRFGP